MESRQVLPKLHRCCSDLHRIPTADEIPKRAVVMLAELAQVPYAELWSRDEADGAVRLTAVNDETFLSDDVPAALDPGQCIIGEIISSGTLRVCPDLLKAPAWSRKEWSARKGLTSLLGVPLFFQDHVMGALSILASSRSQLGPTELQILQLLADQTAVALLHKRTERALRESEEKTRIFFDAALDAVVTVEATGRITGWNAHAESTFGWKRQEILDSTIYETIIPASYREEYEPWLAHLMTMAEASPSNTRMDIMSRRKDGSEIPVEMTISPLATGSGTSYTVFLRDISEQKQAEESLKVVDGQFRETRRCLTNIVDISPDPIISTNENGNVVLFSKSAESLLGYNGTDIIGNNIDELYEDKTWVAEVMDLMRERGGSISEYETLLKAKDGSLVPVSITASILYDDDGAETGTVGFQTDLRESKRMAEELQGAHDDLAKAQADLAAAQASVVAAEKLAALGRLTAGVSHEILNPLNIITLRLHMMLKDPDISPDVSRHLRVLEDQANRISKIAQDLLYFARQRDPERRPLNLNEVVKRTLGLVEHDLRQAEISLELKLSSGLSPVKADEDQLQQVVLNVLTNARDAMPAGGNLSIATYEVRRNGLRCIELRVEDSGDGIPTDQMEKIFDPFFTTKPEGEGTGLGLAICKGIIESHGGDIWAEAGSGGGAAIIIRLRRE